LPERVEKQRSVYAHNAKKSRLARQKARPGFLFFGGIEKSIFSVKIPVLIIPCFDSEGKGRMNPCSAEQIFFAFSRVLIQYEIRGSRVFNSFMKSFRNINGSGNAKTVPILAPEKCVGARSGTKIPVSFSE
jgi:hypothetical protein